MIKMEDQLRESVIIIRNLSNKVDQLLNENEHLQREKDLQQSDHIQKEKHFQEGILILKQELEEMRQRQEHREEKRRIWLQDELKREKERISRENAKYQIFRMTIKNNK